ncbi:bZIP transcription factor [Metarhizium album ARSEF 1941]|uniref:BZIP transcription factor n=1 Tax=Metarhizium album (strain ARSEF 1941) TaxID=1081103 RepID=A0A0B2WP09_METAS|nr:bZIP transcription factor [Metarhizium album ARSEF 1941]KHN95222.1 bZIP transcription factor [Metarhizium album ARSEF 1941]
MTRSSSAEPAKPSSCSKRKGTRSVSTLTPSQLARKRANDREAQRAIRARTKEHIERLERELEDLRSSRGRDKTVQELLRRNKALEDELRQLRDSMGISITSSPYSTTTVYNDDTRGTIPSPRMSPLPSGGADYMSDYGPTSQAYVPMPNCEAWASTLPSSVPSPASSVQTEEYGPGSGYIPTSVPNSMMGTAGIGPVDGKEVKMEYESLHDMMSAPSYMQQNPPHQRPQSWNMYPGVYYEGSQNAAVSR